MREIIKNSDACIVKALRQNRVNWAHHVGRFGFGVRQQHLAKHLLLWRNLGWWNIQKRYNELNVDPLRHPSSGKPRRYEDSLPRTWLVDCLDHLGEPE